MHPAGAPDDTRPGSNPTGSNPTGSNPTASTPTASNPTGSNPTGSNLTGGAPAADVADPGAGSALAPPGAAGSLSGLTQPAAHASTGHLPQTARANAPLAPAILDAAAQLRSAGGRTSLVVRLDPPELGAVLVRLSVNRGKVDVRLSAADGGAVAGLADTSEAVRTLLADNGLQLKDFEVSTGPGSARSSDSPPSESRASGEPGERRPGGPPQRSAALYAQKSAAPTRTGASAAGTWL